MYTTCRVGILSSEISKHSKISPPPSLRNRLTSSPMGVFSGEYGISSQSRTTVGEFYCEHVSTDAGLASSIVQRRS